jgi:hypothetical protein
MVQYLGTGVSSPRPYENADGSSEFPSARVRAFALIWADSELQFLIADRAEYASRLVLATRAFPPSRSRANRPFYSVGHDDNARSLNR